jgi:YjbR
MARRERIEPDAEIVARLSTTALALPEAYEEEAWTGIRWRVRTRTFAHVTVSQAGFESSFRDVTGVTDPTTVLTFRATGEELLALVHTGAPFYKPPWSPTVVGMVIDDHVDWAEVHDLITESFRVCAPQKLAKLLDQLAVHRPGGPSSSDTHAQETP